MIKAFTDELNYDPSSSVWQINLSLFNKIELIVKGSVKSELHQTLSSISENALGLLDLAKEIIEATWHEKLHTMMMKMKELDVDDGDSDTEELIGILAETFGIKLMHNRIIDGTSCIDDFEANISELRDTYTSSCADILQDSKILFSFNRFIEREVPIVADEQIFIDNYPAEMKHLLIDLDAPSLYYTLFSIVKQGLESNTPTQEIVQSCRTVVADVKKRHERLFAEK